MKHITYQVQINTLSGWRTIYHDPCYTIAQMVAKSLCNYCVNQVRICNPALGYCESLN